MWSAVVTGRRGSLLRRALGWRCSVTVTAPAQQQHSEGKELNLGPGRRMIKVGPHLGSKLIGLMEGLLLPSDGFAQPHVHDEYEEVFTYSRVTSSI